MQQMTTIDARFWGYLVPIKDHTQGIGYGVEGWRLEKNKEQREVTRLRTRSGNEARKKKKASGRSGEHRKKEN